MLILLFGLSHLYDHVLKAWAGKSITSIIGIVGVVLVLPFYGSVVLHWGLATVQQAGSLLTQITEDAAAGTIFFKFLGQQLELPLHTITRIDIKPLFRLLPDNLEFFVNPEALATYRIQFHQNDQP